MDTIRLGNAGLKVSRICLGTMTMARSNGATGCSTKKRASPSSSVRLDAGINFFDTADVYSRQRRSESRAWRCAEGYGAQARRDRRG